MKKETAKDLLELIAKFTRLAELAVDEKTRAERSHTVKSLQSRLHTLYTEEQLKFLKKRGGEDAWFELVRVYYFIDQSVEGYTVRSAAANWKEQPTWGPYGHKYEAIMKIDELIKFKIHDRKRGFGNTEKDIERATCMADLMANINLGISTAISALMGGTHA